MTSLACKVKIFVANRDDGIAVCLKNIFNYIFFNYTTSLWQILTSAQNQLSIANIYAQTTPAVMYVRADKDFIGTTMEKAVQVNCNVYIPEIYACNDLSPSSIVELILTR